MSTLTPPKANIPIGSVMVAGQMVDCMVNAEWLRYLTQSLFVRGGGTAALTNAEIASLLENDVPVSAASDPGVQESLRSIDELRNELASIRASVDEIRRAVNDISFDQQFATGFRNRLEEIEGRLA